MSVSTSKRTILPQGRPFLLGESSSDLLYLSWGVRTYGLSPIPPTRHEGWVYLLVRSGSPLFVRPGKPTKRIPAGHCLVIEPDCAAGWSDTGRQRCEVMTWVWREKPRIGDVSIAPWAIFHLADTAIQRLNAIHQQCREQISRPDCFTPRMLRALRELVDIELERSGFSRNPASLPRLEFALAWLDRHQQEERAVSRLAEYLQISHSTLDRLFKREAGISVAGWIHARKMAQAATMIQEGKLSRKEIAFELGYRHANDFSRAWGKWNSRKLDGRCGNLQPNTCSLPVLGDQRV